MVFIQKAIYIKWLDGVSVINLDGYANIGAQWIAIYVKNGVATYFEWPGIKYILKEIKTFISNKTINANFNRIQSDDSECGNTFVLDLLILC